MNSRVAIFTDAGFLALRVDGLACVNYILDYDDRTPFDILRQPHHLLYNACRCSALIAFEAYECDFGISIDIEEKL